MSLTSLILFQKCLKGFSLTMFLSVEALIINFFVFFPRQSPEDDDSSPVPYDEHRDSLPEPDQLLTASFLRGDYCLVGVSIL